MEQQLLEINNLTIGFPDHGQFRPVVENLSLSMGQGEILGIVGESGSGKSMTALSLMGLLPPEAMVTSGEILLNGVDLLQLPPQECRQYQGRDMSMIFQEPMTSLNPVMKIGAQVGEVLKIHTDLDKEVIEAKVIEALTQVGLKDPKSLCEKYPHQLSGGMRQRVMIAMAIINHPGLIIADEPTTALDVTVQAQILKLLLRIHQQTNTAMLFISHDLNVIKEVCHQVVVVYKGQVVEAGPVSKVLYHPEHKYTQKLVAHIPKNETVISERTPLVSVEHLNVYYKEKNSLFSGKKLRKQVLKDVGLEIYRGEILGIVGESGCGKSTFAKTLVGLIDDFEGKIDYKEKINPQMVFQDPFSSLNPAKKIGWIMEEPLKIHGNKDRKDRRYKVEEMLEHIGLSPEYANRYADELSGGQRQRISIGTALMRNPRMLIADEPVSALDVTVQSQILSLLLKLHQEHDLTYVFISHDLDVVRHMCNRVAVMYLGEILELAEVADIYDTPAHPYTQILLNAILDQSGTTGEAPVHKEEVRKEIEGAADKGCPFYMRCPMAMKRCAYEKPSCVNIGKEGKPHLVKCFQITD